MSKNAIYVAAGIVLRNKQIFLTKRAQAAHQGGKWEFPGGKVEQGETVEQALLRELNEEIGIEVTTSNAFMTISHDYPEKKVVLDFFLVTQFDGEPSGCEGQEFSWFDIAVLAELDFPEANQAVVDQLLVCGCYTKFIK
jgi:8-oxo-dGTP diphosphatase